MTSGGGRRRRVSALVIALSGAVALVAAEGFIRLTSPAVSLARQTGVGRHRNPMETWAVIDAFSAYRHRPGRGMDGKSVNSHGFVSTPEVPLEKPPGTVRVLFLGESSTAGTGVELVDQETWPWQTAEMLRQRLGHEVDFLNGAVSGYTTFESYGRLWSRDRHFSPDVVVVMHGWNELQYFAKMDAILAWRRLDDGGWSFDTQQAPGNHPPWPVDRLIGWSQLLTRSRLALARAVGSQYETPGGGTPAREFDPRGLAVFTTHLELMARLCETIGARLFVVKQPTLMVPNGAPEHRRRCRINYHGLDYEGRVAAMAAIHHAIDASVAPEAVIDLTPLSGRLDYFHDAVHPTPEGAREIARRVAARLAETLGPAPVPAG